MSKMTKPTVGVVKFHESDVIVASGEILNISNLGNGGGETQLKGDGLWEFGTGHYYSNDIYPSPSNFVEYMGSYLGTHFDSISDIKIGNSNAGTLVSNDMTDLPGSVSGDAAYNGTWRWNGSRFVKQ